MNTFRRVIFIMVAGLLASPVLATSGDDDAEKCQSLYKSGDYQQALAPCTKAAEQGNGESQFNLGRMYHKGGDGVAKDYKQAHRWYSSADEQGYTDTDSKTFLKDMYYHSEERSSIIYVLEDPELPRGTINPVYSSPKRNCVLAKIRGCLAYNKDPSSCMAGVASGAYGHIPKRFDVSYNKSGFAQGFSAGSTCKRLDD